MHHKRQLKAEYLTVAELEAITGKSKWSWRRMCYSGRISSVKLGKSLLVPVSELERLMAENTRPSAPEK
jgi:Helix-turn-helix domain